MAVPAVGLCIFLHIVTVHGLFASFLNSSDNSVEGEFDWGDDLDEARFTNLAARPAFWDFQDLEDRGSGTAQPKRKMNHNSLRRLLALKVERGQARDSDLRNYAAMYHSAFQDKHLIYLVHVSKSAGTLLCDCARTKCNVYKPQMWNCAPQSLMSDGFKWNINAFLPNIPARPPSKRHCAAADYIYRSHGFTFVANENTVLNDAVCPKWWNVIIFRNPINRLMSHMAALWCKGHKPDVKALNPHKLTLHKLYEVAPTVTDNYYVRVLGGQDVFDKPHGTITTWDLENAKRRLKDFDSVFILNRNLNSHINQELGIGCGGGTHEFGVCAYTKEFDTILHARWSQRDWNELARTNRFDMELFEYAKGLRDLDRAVLQHPAFLSAQSQMFAVHPHGKCGKLAPNAPR